jgi:NAD(P)H-hydrate repair Nnr-like enzyme with NAD(P)H-hydrate epimerase domain
MSRPIYLTQDIRRIEQEAGNVSPPLMERAGAAAADLAATLLPDTGKDVLVLAGPGNNGGDAKIVARLLQERFFRVTLVDTPTPPPAKSFNLIVDGLFGIGLSRPIEGAYAKLVDYVNSQACPFSRWIFPAV